MRFPYLAAATAALLFAPVAAAQDFYDTTVLRTVSFDFQDTNWWQLLNQNYQSQTNILADMTVEGIVYPDVGVRIRGNTSYFALPPGSEKVSLNIETDFVHPDQDVMGFSNLNFNNAFTDPTFCREVLYMNVLAEWIPSGRANHVVVELEGQNWGVYANVQQFDKTMLREFFEDEDGLRVKIPNNPNGPGLQYVGPDPNSYSQYEIKDPGQWASPFDRVIQLCEVVDTVAPVNWRQIDRTCAVDPSIWTVAFENLFADDDSYINKGADFVFYENPIDGRSHILQTDGNETFKEENWPLDYNFNANSKPFLSNVLSAPDLRQRYVAHMRAILGELDWSVLGPKAEAHRLLIDAAVQADPKKLYTYNQFLANFSNTVTLPGPPQFGGPTTGLQEFAIQRRGLLSSQPEIRASAPVIADVSTDGDQPGTTVHVTATITGPTHAVADAWLWYRSAPTSRFTSIAMADDGLSGDGAAGDGVYGVALPIVGLPGQEVPFYIEAISANSFSTAAYLPVRTELAPNVLVFDSSPAASDIVINEAMAQNQSGIQDASGSFEDWFELYNRGSGTIDLSGLYLTDSTSQPSKWQIPAGTTIAPGATLFFWADDDVAEGPDHAAFKLSAGGELVALYDTDGATLVTRLEFGAQVPDVSTGPIVDGGQIVYSLLDPTPGALNLPASGSARFDQQDPAAHPLDLDPIGSGALGSTLELAIESVAPGATAFIGWGFAPVHLTNLNGVQLVDPAQILGPLFADGAGDVSWTATVPNEPALVGGQLYFQGAVVNGLALDLTSAVVVVVGP